MMSVGKSAYVGENMKILRNFSGNFRWFSKICGMICVKTPEKVSRFPCMR